MFPYTLYDPRTGRIISTMEVPDKKYAPGNGTWSVAIEGHYPPDDYYYDLATDTVQPRGTFDFVIPNSASVGATLQYAPVPVGTRIHVDADMYNVNDGVFDMVLTTPGDYEIYVLNIAYRPLRTRLLVT